MTEPIERVYVIENNQPDENEASGVDIDLPRAERFAKAIGGTIRVFTEERRWNTQRAPDNGRLVQVLFATGWPTGPIPRVVIARFGSESKWVTEDHDLRQQELDVGTVLAWRKLPDIPDLRELPLRAPEWR